MRQPKCPRYIMLRCLPWSLAGPTACEVGADVLVVVVEASLLHAQRLHILRGPPWQPLEQSLSSGIGQRILLSSRLLSIAPTRGRGGGCGSGRIESASNVTVQDGAGMRKSCRASYRSSDAPYIIGNMYGARLRHA